MHPVRQSPPQLLLQLLMRCCVPHPDCHAPGGGVNWSVASAAGKWVPSVPLVQSMKRGASHLQSHDDCELQDEQLWPVHMDAIDRTQAFWVDTGSFLLLQTPCKQECCAIDLTPLAITNGCKSSCSCGTALQLRGWHALVKNAVVPQSASWTPSSRFGFCRYHGTDAGVRIFPNSPIWL